jgi:hypothetical protein
MPRGPSDGSEAQSVVYLFSAKQRALSNSRASKERAHPVLAPLAWFVCYLFGAAVWIGFAYFILNLF